MARGYMGKLLFVDLSTGEIKEESPDESLYHDYIGGYGIGSRILYDRMKAGVDPLGPKNMMGFLTGPFTGTNATFAGRYCIVAKSPITNGWGDGNGGGNFAPVQKFAGYDGVFVTGESKKPVYLLLDNGMAKIEDARHLWGKDCFKTEEILKQTHGKNSESLCIGPPGERKSRLACIVTKRGAVAGRCGFGAVMGSKKLKALAVRGNMEVPVFDPDAVKQLRKEHIAMMKNATDSMETFEGFHKYGTSRVAEIFAHSGNTPVKNWSGVGVIDLPDPSGLSGNAAIANLEKRSGCWHCPIRCEGLLKEGKEYKYPAGTRRVEYETQGSFGTMCLNTNTESLNMINHLCNCYGIDTIAAGCTMAFAIECYENGLITKEDTNGIELTWGNHQAIVAMTEKMVKGEGLGAILVHGSKFASEKIGKGAEELTVHFGGAEIGMHDPRCYNHPGTTAAARYQMDATPGHHTQMNFGTTSFQMHLINTTGCCMFIELVGGNAMKYITGFMKAVTGWDRGEEELFKAAERVVNMRHVFNLREGINPLEYKVPPRIIGRPPQTEGPLIGVTVDIEEQISRGLDSLDWDRTTTKPSKQKLLALGLDDVADDLWPLQ